MPVRGMIIAPLAKYQRDINCLLCHSCKYLAMSEVPKDSLLIVMSVLICKHPGNKGRVEVDIIDPLFTSADAKEYGHGMITIVTSCAGYAPALGADYAKNQSASFLGCSSERA